MAYTSPTAPIVPAGDLAANIASYRRHLRSVAKLRRDSGASMEEVQTLLGHRSLATTATYLRRLEGEGDSGWAPVAATLGLEADA